MRTVRSIRSARRLIERFRRRGRSLGFIPTMGALHEGHLSLVRLARRQCDAVVASIFVNPSQFGPGEDYTRYPRTMKADLRKLKSAGVDLVLTPSVRGIYPKGFDTWISAGRADEQLEGRSRPGHFTGVATVVFRLIRIVGPDKLYLGRKDYQQTVVIRRMIRDLDLDVKAVLCPTVRETDGLAMSSRNRYLSQRERKAATVLWRALSEGKEAVRKGNRNAAAIRSLMRRIIRREPLARIDYVAVADPETMEQVRRIKGRVVFALAVRIGNTRLIDNIVVSAGKLRSR